MLLMLKKICEKVNEWQNVYETCMPYNLCITYYVYVVLHNLLSLWCPSCMTYILCITYDVMHNKLCTTYVYKNLCWGAWLTELRCDEKHDIVYIMYWEN